MRHIVAAVVIVCVACWYVLQLWTRRSLTPAVFPLLSRAVPLKSGDLVVCRANNVRWAHVAIVLRDPYTSQLLAWEARRRHGAVLRPLLQMVQGWKYCAVRSLSADVNDAEFLRFIHARIGQPFALDCVAVAGKRALHTLLACLPTTDDGERGACFCSELARDTYIALGIFRKYTESMLPEDFVCSSTMPLRDRYNFAEAARLTTQNVCFHKNE